MSQSFFQRCCPAAARGWFRGLALLSIAAPAATAGEWTAIRGGTVMNPSGETTEAVVVLIEDGIIKEVGAEVEIPYDAEVIEADGKVLFPGMILAETQQGLDRGNENVPVTPYVNVYDAIDPYSVSFEEALRTGVTTLHVIPGNACVISGLSRIVKPVGMMVEDMTVRPDVALKVSISPKRGNNRMTQMAVLRKAFADLDRHVQEVAERRYEEEQEEAGKKVTVMPEEAAKRGMELLEVHDLDQKWRTLYRFKNGEVPMFLHCDRAGDALRGIEFMNEMELAEQTTFVLGTETFKVVDEIKATGRPVVLSGILVHRETDPLTGDEIETFVPKVFADAGVKFALDVHFGSMGESFLWYQAARLVREGVATDVALKAITQWPADIIGMGEKLGSVSAGKYGNVLLLTGSPLDQSTWVDRVVLEGEVVYDRDEDRRLKELLSGEELPLSDGGE